MKRMSIVGLCLIAAVAMSAIGAASASAAAPEFGRCLNISPKPGKFKTAACTAKATETEKNFEWFPGNGAVAKNGESRPIEKNKFTSKLNASTLATLESEGGTKITCKTQVLTHPAEITGAKTAGKIQAKYNSCKALGVGCNSTGAAAEEIVTTELGAEIGFQTGTKPSVKNKAASNIFSATHTGPLAEFACATLLQVKVHGSLLHPATVNKMLLAAKETFTAKVGEQAPHKFSTEACAPEGLEQPEGPGTTKDKTIAEEENPETHVKECDNHNLISKLETAGKYEESGQSQANTTTDEEPIEISTLN